MNEQQIEELEALESIFFDILQKDSDTTFSLTIQGENAGIKLSVLFTETYPDEPPHFDIKPLDDLPEGAERDLHELITNTIEKGLGSAMMFDIVEAVREWLENIPSEADLAEAMPAAPARKEYATYTPVTPESFAEWKRNFDEEMSVAKQVQRDALKNQVFLNGLTYQEVWNKPTGREIFERQLEPVEVSLDEEEKE